MENQSSVFNGILCITLVRVHKRIISEMFHQDLPCDFRELLKSMYQSPDDRLWVITIAHSELI